MVSCSLPPIQPISHAYQWCAVASLGSSLKAFLYSASPPAKSQSYSISLAPRTAWGWANESQADTHLVPISVVHAMLPLPKNWPITGIIPIGPDVLSRNLLGNVIVGDNAGTPQLVINLLNQPIQQ